MAQVTSLSIPNGSGAAARANINLTYAALFSGNSGASAPTTTVAGMLWLDTSANPAQIRVRNAGNTAWIAIGRETLPALNLWGNPGGSAAAMGPVTPAQLQAILGFSTTLTAPYSGLLVPGLLLQAGSGSTGASGTTVTFPTSYSAPPVVVAVASLSSFGARFVTTRAITSSSVYVDGFTDAGAQANIGFSWFSMGAA